MRVAVVTEPVAVLAEDDMQVSAPQDTRVSVPDAMRAELVMATVELELAMVLAAIARASMHLESRADATAATAATGKAITHREPRRGIRFIVLLRVRKAEALPDSLPDRQSILAATTFHGINRLSALRANPVSSNALARLQKVQLALGNTLSRQNPVNTHRLDPQTKQRLRNWQGKAPGWNDAKRNHHDNWRDRHHHDHNWWHRYCPAIVLVGSGYWGWYDGWWYPALGYDSYYSDYDYNGPIYGYDGLQPDEVIANVQAALQQLGYYAYTVDGVLGSATEAAIANYQRDNGLPVTGAIDPVTVRSLGLSS